MFFSPAISEAIMGEEWEIGEKPSPFLGPHESCIGQEYAWNWRMHENFPLDEKMNILATMIIKFGLTNCSDNFFPFETTPVSNEEVDHRIFPPGRAKVLSHYLILYPHDQWQSLHYTNT